MGMNISIAFIDRTFLLRALYYINISDAATVTELCNMRDNADEKFIVFF